MADAFEALEDLKKALGGSDDSHGETWWNYGGLKVFNMNQGWNKMLRFHVKHGETPHSLTWFVAKSLVSYLFKPKPIPTVTNAGNSFFRLLIPGVHLLNSLGWNDMGDHLYMNLWSPVLDEDPTTVRSCVRSRGCCTSDGAGYGMERLFICWNSAKRSDWISMAFESIEKCSNPCCLMIRGDATQCKGDSGIHQAVQSGILTFASATNI